MTAFTSVEDTDRFVSDAASDAAVVRDIWHILMNFPKSKFVGVDLYSWRLYQGKRYKNDTERSAGKWKAPTVCPAVC